VLRDCFGGLITLTEVSGRQAADIVVQYVPTAGGVVFGGYATCGDHGRPNILVRSDLPPSLDRDPYSPEYLGWVTLHELGHGLGLGYATNLLESTDLMGYGWPDLGESRVPPRGTPAGSAAEGQRPRAYHGRVSRRSDAGDLL
jgi:hypothetical protein